MVRLALLLLVCVCRLAPAAQVETLSAGSLPEEAILRSGRTFAWVRALEADVAREPSNAGNHAALALGYFLLRQRRFSHEEMQRALALDPHAAEVNYIAGRIEMDLDQDYRGAMPRFEAVLAVSKDNFKARYFLAMCLRGLGKHEEALTEFRKAAATAPYDWAWVAIAEEELNAGDAQQALEAAQKASGMNRSAENLVLMAKAWMALDQAGKARECLEDAVKIDPGWETPHYLLARIYAKNADSAAQTRAERQRFEELRNAAQ